MYIFLLHCIVINPFSVVSCRLFCPSTSDHYYFSAIKPVNKSALLHIFTSTYSHTPPTLNVEPEGAFLAMEQLQTGTYVKRKHTGRTGQGCSQVLNTEVMNQTPTTNTKKKKIFIQSSPHHKRKC